MLHRLTLSWYTDSIVRHEPIGSHREGTNGDLNIIIICVYLEVVSDSHSLQICAGLGLPSHHLRRLDAIQGTINHHLRVSVVLFKLC